MCRLAFIPRAFDGMSNWLRQMERSNGGHGTGVACGTRMFKGRDVTAIDSAREISLAHREFARAKKRRLPALWHTRLASIGGLHDDLCHPFACDGGWLVHNGHWHEMAVKARGITNVPMSDTRLFACLVNKDGFLKSVKHYKPPGVWLHMLYDGQLAVWKGSGSLVHCPKLGAFGSEAPRRLASDLGWFDVASGLYDYDEEPALTEIENKCTKNVVRLFPEITRNVNVINRVVYNDAGRKTDRFGRSYEIVRNDMENAK